MTSSSQHKQSQAGARSSLVRKNIVMSFLIKGCSGLIQLLLVPMTLFCLGNYENGIWMTISSMLVWIDSLDIGLGNGMRNRLAQELAHNDLHEARISVSSVYGMLGIIIVPATILMLLFVNTIDLYSALNVDANIIGDLQEVLSLSIVFVAFTFIFKAVGNVYMALQLPAVNNALVMAGQALVLVVVLVFRYTGIHSLLLVSIAYTLCPLIVYLIAFPITFHVVCPALRPSLRMFRWKEVCLLLNSGIKFFILQICGVILFMSSNIIISRLFSPSFVTPYQIAYKYFSIVILLFTIIVTPYWSAATDAWERKDKGWIRSSMRKIQRIITCFAVMLLLMVVVSNPVYKLWVGSGVQVPLLMSALMALYVFVIVFSMSYSYILNGLGVLNLQLICTVVAAVVYVPLAVVLSHVIGIDGILIALITVNLPGMVINRLQYNRILGGTANGIWLK